MAAVLLAAVLVITACARAAPVADRPPEDLTLCMKAPLPPLPLPPVRMPQRLLQWATETEAARARTVAARNDCAARLSRLNQWIAEHRPSLTAGGR